MHFQESGVHDVSSVNRTPVLLEEQREISLNGIGFHFLKENKFLIDELKWAILHPHSVIEVVLHFVRSRDLCWGRDTTKVLSNLQYGVLLVTPQKYS